MDRDNRPMDTDATRRDRLGVIVVGPVAGVGLMAGFWLGLWIASLVFDPAERGDQSVILFLLDNLFDFLTVAVPIVGGASLFGWIALPALAGWLFGWSRTAMTTGLQIGLGLVATVPAVWLVGWSSDQSDAIANSVPWIALFVVTLGAPTLARYLALQTSSG